MKKKTLGIIIVSVLGAAAIFCSAMFTQQYLDAKNSKAVFDDLTNLITEIDEPQKDAEAEEADLSTEELAAAEAALAHEKYDALFEQNNDFTWKDFQARNNNELVAVYGNFVNRALVLTHKYFDGKVPACGELNDYDRETLKEFADVKEEVEKLLI